MNWPFCTRLLFCCLLVSLMHSSLIYVKVCLTNLVAKSQYQIYLCMEYVLPTRLSFSIPDFIIICFLAPRRRQTNRIDDTVSACSFSPSTAIRAAPPFYKIRNAAYQTICTTYIYIATVVYVVLRCDGLLQLYVLMGVMISFWLYFVISLYVPIGRLRLNCVELVYFCWCHLLAHFLLLW